jgi:hypothetical protein
MHAPSLGGRWQFPASKTIVIGDLMLEDAYEICAAPLQSGTMGNGDTLLAHGVVRIQRGRGIFLECGRTVPA